MIKDVGNVFVTQSVVDGDGGESEQIGGNVSDGPLHAILGENTEHFHALSFRYTKQALRHNSAADLMCTIDGLFVGDVIN